MQLVSSEVLRVVQLNMLSSPATRRFVTQQNELIPSILNLKPGQKPTGLVGRMRPGHSVNGCEPRNITEMCTP